MIVSSLKTEKKYIKIKKILYVLKIKVIALDTNKKKLTNIFYRICTTTMIYFIKILNHFLSILLTYESYMELAYI